jgi:hypothetical protein
LLLQDAPAFVAGLQFASNRFKAFKRGIDIIRGTLIETDIIYRRVQLRLFSLKRLDTCRQGIEFTLVLVRQFLRLAGRLRL